MSKRVISEEVALKSVEKVTEDLGTLTELLEKHDGDQAKVDQMFNLSQSCGKCKDLLRTCTASGNTDTKALGSSLEEAIRKLKAAMDQDFYKEQCAHDFFKSLSGMGRYAMHQAWQLQTSSKTVIQRRFQ